MTKRPLYIFDIPKLEHRRMQEHLSKRGLGRIVANRDSAYTDIVYRGGVCRSAVIAERLIRFYRSSDCLMFNGTKKR